MTEIHDWIRQNRDLWLNLEDLDNWKIGTTLTVALFDRNFEEMGNIWDSKTLIRDKLYKPSQMFKDNKTRIKYLGNYKWKIYFNYGESITRDIEVNVEQFNTGWNWYPLNNGILILCDTISNGRMKKLNKKIIVNADDLESHVEIGWRGPIMLWSSIKSSEDEVYYD